MNSGRPAPTRSSTSLPEDAESHPPASPRQALLVVSLANFEVLEASPLASVWLDYPLDRLLGRSLMLSIPPLGQALSLAVASGLGEVPTPLGISLVNPDGARLLAHVHQRGAEARIALVPADRPGDHAAATSA